jgi:DsbC/DsbD-like thiol-disulfide interchange protein
MSDQSTIGSILLCLGLAVASIAPAHLARAEPVNAPPGQGAALPGGAGSVGLLSGWREPGGRHMAGLAVTLAPGWKTYWRAPGEAGIPPEFDWSGSRNVARVAVHWPRPIVFDQAGITSIGYADEMILPLEIVPTDPSAPIDLNGEVTLGVCRDICIPVSARFALRLDAPGAADPRIRGALDRRPERLHGQVTCGVAAISDGLRLTAVVPSDWEGVEALVVELPDPQVWVSQAEVSREGPMVAAVVDLVPPSGGAFALDRSTLRFTMIAGGRVAETTGCTAN